MPSYSQPVPIDPVTFGCQPSLGVPYTSMVSGPYSFGGALYIVLCNSDTFALTPLDVWKSTDGGATWAAVDHAHAPNTNVFQVCFDGAHTIWAIVQDTSLGPPFPFFAISFNLNTQLWGTLSAGSPGQGGTPVLLLPRADGSILVGYTHSVNLLVTSLLGGVWSGEVAADTNALAAFAPATSIGLENVFGAVDSTGRVHLFFAMLDSDVVSHLFYQGVETGVTLGSFFEFPGACGDIPCSSGSLATSFGIPLVQGTAIALPLYIGAGAFSHISLYVGTPLNAPVWTLSSDIDPLFAGIDNSLQFYVVPAVSFVDSLVQVVYGAPDGVNSNGIVRLVTAATLAGPWTGLTAFNAQSSSIPPGYQFSGATVGPLVVSGGILYNGATTTGDTPNLRFFSALASSFTISCGSPTGGRVGLFYIFTFPAPVGGVAPFTYAITAGLLPPGLSLSAAGVISGTPSAAGTYAFTLTVTDSTLATASCSTSITITAVLALSSGSSSAVRPVEPCCPPAVLVLQAERLRRLREAQEIWPFPWRVPPPSSKHVFQRATIAAPATAASTLILSYQVPNGENFVLESVVLTYAGSGGGFGAWTPGDGNVTFSLLLNAPAGSTDAPQSRPFKDYGAILFPLGDPTSAGGAWEIDPGELSILESRDTLGAFVVINPLVITDGLFTAVFRGWTWPTV